VDGFVGALPESQIKQFLERLVGPVGDPVKEALGEAAAALAEGDAETAAAIYAEILEADDNNPAAIAGLAKLHLEAGRLDDAKAVLAAAKGSAAQDAAVAAARAAIDLAEQSAGLGDLGDLERRIVQDPDDFQARFDLALALNAKNKREDAADQLLDIIGKDRSWNDDGARKQLLQFFEAWGFADPASANGRRKLSGLLFR
ncbi:MAG TPA: tetratricopeptide repeat protein, partial [Lichenihabitans sp.]|nr:tetratricopeptide repeat protein [Lichenihabitans sp.]